MAYRKSPDAELLRAALYGYERQRDKIDEKMTAIRLQLAGAPQTGAAEQAEPGRRRGMSEKGKLRIAAAQRKRWATLKKTSGDAPARPKKKRNMSAEGRQRIIEATRKRWAAYRADKEAAG